MLDPRIEKLAKLLVKYSVAVKPDDLVVLTGSTVGEPILAAVFQEVVLAGGHPWLHMYSEDCTEIFLKHASKRQLAYRNPLDRAVINTVNARIHIWGEQNTRSLSGVDPARQAISSQARKPVLDLFMRRAALPANDPRRLRWVGTGIPTQAAAQDADMSLRDYAEFVFRAGKLHRPDPVAEWKKAAVAQQRLADRLQKARELRIKAPGGTDIRFGIRGRRWINCAGHENFPDGEVFTGPIEDATEGQVRFTYPAVHDSREVCDIRLVFKAGRVVDASASKGEDFLIKMLDQDKGARVLGELALGTNYDVKRFTRNTLFDEKIGGTAHMALGAAYPESGGKNTSGLHWDMVCELRKGGVVELDGEVISRNGKFTNAKWPH